MKRHLTLTVLALLATLACAQAPTPAPPEISAEMQKAYYKTWGEFQSLIAQFQQSLTSSQKLLQEQVKTKAEDLNKMNPLIAAACGGNLDQKALIERNVIQCLPAAPVAGPPEGQNPTTKPKE